MHGCDRWSRREWGEATLELGGDIRDGVADLLPPVASVRTLCLKALPDDFVPTVDRWLTTATGTDWVDPFVTRSRLILGGSGSGKTTWMLEELIRAGDRGDLVTICDTDYGSAHVGSRPNTWLGADRRHVRYTPEDILDTLVEHSDLVDQRAIAAAEGRPVDLAPRTLIVDEFSGVRRWAETEGKETLTAFDNSIRNLLSRGLKQRVTFVLGSQNPDVALTGIKVSDLNQTNLLFLGGFAQDSRVLSLYGLRGQGGDLAAEAGQLAAHGRPAVVKLDHGPRAVLMPPLDHQAVQSAPESPAVPWADQHREDVAAMKALGASLTQVAKNLGIKQSSKDPVYSKLKDLYREV
jgi:hypothetical protein